MNKKELFEGLVEKDVGLRLIVGLSRKGVSRHYDLTFERLHNDMESIILKIVKTI